MSRVTAALLGRPAPAKAVRRWQPLLGTVAGLLAREHGMPDLGNLADPVQEVFYILLASKTTDSQYRLTFAALQARYNGARDLAEADPSEVAGLIRPGGIGRLKAGRLIETARVIAGLGPDPAGRMREMALPRLYRFLTGMPGIGPKSALCIMMCSFGADVFPVDVNVARIAVRLGVVKPGLRHWKYQERLPGLVPEGRSKELHVGMVVHGRTICTPLSPKCGSCAIRHLCPVGKAVG